jgi:Na+-driven multidrug efflux pump
MKTVNLSRPLFGFVVATRAILGVGIGLLVADRLGRRRRRRVGAALAAIGVLSTIPAALAIFRRNDTEPGTETTAA